MWAMFRFTLIESIRRGALIFYAAVGTIILVLLAFGISRSSSDTSAVNIFGLPFFRSAAASTDILAFVLAMLQKQATGSLVLLGIFGVAGLIPSFLEKGTADLFLSKPISRPTLFLARSFGASAAIALNLLYFFVGTWLIFGIKLGYWHWNFLLASLLIAFAFACFFSLIALVGVMTRSMAISVMLGFLFTIISTGLELRETGLYKIWDNALFHRLLDGLYYLTPQLDAMFNNASLLIAQLPTPFGPTEFTIKPFLFSLASAAFLYACGVLYFKRQDF